jgi:hypothetical protein
MSILASDLFTGIRAQLDDDNSGRYSEVNDLTPIVNQAINYLITLFNAGFDQKKIQPESLQELIRTVIVTASGTGSVKQLLVTSVQPTIWTVLGVDPDPDTQGSSPVLYVDSKNRMATRMSISAWNEACEDPFAAGTAQDIPAGLIRASYIGPGRFLSTTDFHILVRPASVFTNNQAAIWYLQNPTLVTSGSTNIDFPRSMFNWLVQKSLNYLSLQQGPESKLGPVTEKEISLLGSLLSI